MALRVRQENGSRTDSQVSQRHGNKTGPECPGRQHAKIREIRHFQGSNHGVFLVKRTGIGLWT